MSVPEDETRRGRPPEERDEPDDELGVTVPLPARELTAGRSAEGGKSLHAERMDKLARERSDTHLRYELREEIGRGGMGAVYEVWDTDLRRSLAMKVILGDTGSQLGTTAAKDEALVRFLEEAQVSAQLDHPGVVPVHELGVDSEGRVYFTMRFVKGRNLREIIADVHAGREGWTLTRALGAIVKVCETMAFAHAKGVVHRDLKPANVMVGRYGEVYVMDWGLASAKGRERYAADIRLQPDSGVSLTEIRTDRREAEEELDSPLMTMDGTWCLVCRVSMRW